MVNIAKGDKMIKLLVLITFIISLSGCAGLDMTLDILDILVPDPVEEVVIEPTPICNVHSIGVVDNNGAICLAFTDGTYMWTKHQQQDYKHQLRHLEGKE